MDRIPEKVLDNVLSNLAVMDLFRLQVVSKAFKESCRCCLKSRQKLIVCEILPVDDRENYMYKCMSPVFLERLRQCSLDDAIRPKLFKLNSEAILNRMTGLKELYIMDYGHNVAFLHRHGLRQDILTLILKKCLGLEYLYVFTDVLRLIPDNQLSLKYLCGCLRVKALLSVIEKSPSLEGLGIDLHRELIPHRNQEFEEVLPALLTKLPFGLKWFKIQTSSRLQTHKLSSLFCSEAMKTLQDLSMDTYNSATDLPMFFNSSSEEADSMDFNSGLDSNYNP